MQPPLAQGGFISAMICLPCIPLYNQLVLLLLLLPLRSPTRLLPHHKPSGAYYGQPHPQQTTTTTNDHPVHNNYHDYKIQLPLQLSTTIFYHKDQHYYELPLRTTNKQTRLRLTQTQAAGTHPMPSQQGPPPIDGPPGASPVLQPRPAAERPPLAVR